LPTKKTFYVLFFYSASASDDEMKKKFKKLKKTIKQLTKYTKHLVKKNLVSAEDLKDLRSTSGEVKKVLKEVRDHQKNRSHLSM
jgi:gas vesicle protein